MTIAASTNPALPNIVLSVADWGANTGSTAPTTLTAGGSVAVTGTNSSVSYAGFCYVNGVNFSSGTAGNSCILIFNSTFPWAWTLEACTLRTVTTGNATSSGVVVGVNNTNLDDCVLRLVNTKINFSQVLHRFIVSSRFVWKDTPLAIDGATVPTVLIAGTFGIPAMIEIENVDLAAIVTGKSVIDISMASRSVAKVRRCTLGTGGSRTTGTIPGPGGMRASFEECAAGTISGTPLGLTEFVAYEGTAAHSLTRYRTGGADDGEQANPYSMEMTTNASALEIYNPLEVTLGSIWMGPDASISGATSRGIVTSYRAGPLATPDNLTTDTVSTWTGTGTGTKQKIDHTLSNGDTLTVYVASGVTLQNDEFWIEVSEPDQVAGLVTVKALLAKPSTTVYVDPKIEVA
jgi:hypothetical protein